MSADIVVERLLRLVFSCRLTALLGLCIRALPLTTNLDSAMMAGKDNAAKPRAACNSNYVEARI